MKEKKDININFLVAFVVDLSCVFSNKYVDGDLEGLKCPPPKKKGDFVLSHKCSNNYESD